MFTQGKPNSSKQMKITSLFSRIPQESSTTIDESHGVKTPTPKSVFSPVSSPDIILPSPVLEKKKATRAKKSLNRLLVDNVEINNKLTISQTHSVELVSKKTLDISTKSPENLKEDDYDADGQSCYGTESMASTICDETDFCSDLVFDDWTDDLTSA